MVSHPSRKKIPARSPLLLSLIDAQDSCLVIIDAQEVFFDKLEPDLVEPLIQRIKWLIKVAVRLDIPLIVTAEDIDQNGSIRPDLEVLLPQDTKVHNKMVFNLAADPDILDTIQQTNRNTMVLIGLETDVCVAQSVMGLLQEEYQVAVVADGTASPGQGYGYGLSRIRDTGALITTVKSLFYEWMKTIPRTREFFNTHGDSIGDPGIIL